MAYTGTGTQSDPYVVTTFADFLECVAQDGVYVEVGADLDAAAEGFGYVEPIDVKAVEVYGTSGDTLRKISNVTVEGSSCFLFDGDAATTAVMSLHFENLSYKVAGSTSPKMFNRTITTKYAVVRYCKISANVTADTANVSVALTNRCAIMDSAFVLQLHGGVYTPSSGAAAANEITNSTIRMEGDGVAAMVSMSTASDRFNYATNAGIILKSMVLKGAIGFNAGDGFSYMVMEDCQVPSTFNVHAVKSSNLICFAGTTDASGATVNSGTVVTQSQLKDKSYLQSIGWLP